MYTEQEFISVQKLLIRLLKRSYDVDDHESVMLATSYEPQEKLWYVKGMFDQRHTGTAQMVDYCSRNATVEPRGPWMLEGWGETPTLALFALKKRINKLLRVKHAV